MIKIYEYLYNINIYSNFIVDKRKYCHDEEDPFGVLSINNKTGIYSFIKLIYNNSNGCYLDRKYKIAIDFINKIEESNNIRDMQIVNYYNYAVQKVC